MARKIRFEGCVTITCCTLTAIVVGYLVLNEFRLAFFERRIKAHMHTSGVAVFPLRDMTSFSWDTMTIGTYIADFSTEDSLLPFNILFFTNRFEVNEIFDHDEYYLDEYSPDDHVFVCYKDKKYHIFRAEKFAVDFCHLLFSIQTGTSVTMKASEVFPFTWCRGKVNIGYSYDDEFFFKFHLIENPKQYGEWIGFTVPLQAFSIPEARNESKWGYKYDEPEIAGDDSITITNTDGKISIFFSREPVGDHLPAGESYPGLPLPVLSGRQNVGY